MKIEKIQLRNFRGAMEFELPIDPQLTIIVGVNGSGKTTVLDAVAILLSWLIARIKRDNGIGRHINEIDIKNRQNYSEIILQGVEIEWSIAKVRKGKSEPIKSHLSMLASYVKKVRETIDIEAMQSTIPVFAYYSVNRAVLDIPLKIRKKHAFDIFSIYDDSLTSSANFRVFFEWFREREDIENENRKYLNTQSQPDDFEFPDKQLEAVREALESFLPDYTDFSVKREPLRMVVTKTGKELRIDNLSDGEKVFIALLGDIARRLAIANPGKRKPLEGSGIILIDEIDLHLHPTWQRMVVPKLLHVFPNIQFIIATHSPQILSEVSAKHIRKLTFEDGKMSFIIPSQSYGLTSFQILNELMEDSGINSEVQKKIELIFTLIDEENFFEAKKQIGSLKQELNGSIPDIIEAESTISMLEPETGEQE